MTDTIVVTRHQGLVDYLLEIGLITPDTPVLSHASADDVRGRHVIGVLPLHLAALAERVTEVPLALTPEDRGKDLPVERVREIAGSPVTYQVNVVAR
ncbi:MAG: hypothetical protein KatS3mg031_2784 [Chitinophagales bacterium]|nr:MAG: hypothetical protein KatS3mg031_2784 [Chitinophagales bacterium]